MRQNDEAKPTMSPPNLGFPLPTAAVNSLASRVPFPVWGLTVCALFLIVGVAVLDDYGISWDEFHQRIIAAETVAYALGDVPLVDDHNKFYGAAFELPLLLVERVLGLEDTRSISLSRHILTHLFFIVGGFFCCLLAYRLSNSHLVALTSRTGHSAGIRSGHFCSSARRSGFWSTSASWALCCSPLFSLCGGWTSSTLPGGRSGSAS